ncbi:TatD related DNase [Zea mays]|uniref:TatD related DNase n=1 Tax=Zea mays TaxID=4577 RepID=A0A1D6F9G1_MAIZE|nr:TatD related DNase [Zea mays]
MSSKFCRSLLLVNVVWIMTDFSSVRQICKRSIQSCSPMHRNWHLIYSFLSDLFCIRYFEKQFELAEAVKLPMFLHMRAAGEDFCEIMTRNLHRFPGGVTHSFTDSAEDRDMLLSFEKMFIGKISLPSNKNLHLLQHDKLQSKDSQLTTL